LKPEASEETKIDRNKERKKMNTVSNAVFRDISFIKRKKEILQLPLNVTNRYGKGRFQILGFLFLK
jgi:hypothetical protein